MDYKDHAITLIQTVCERNYYGMPTVGSGTEVTHQGMVIVRGVFTTFRNQTYTKTHEEKFFVCV